MLRRISRPVMPRPAALTAGCRSACSGGILYNFLGHMTGAINPATYTTLAALPYSPLGTGALVLLAYNVSVVGVKHLWYALEMVSKDYHQDQQLQVLVRYLLLVSLLISVEALFVEA
jgi:hypothetical protein